MDNILVDCDNNAKIVDFSLSCVYEEVKNFDKNNGKLYFLSPEILSNKNFNLFNSDIWSLGIILYAMLNGFLPFEDRDCEKL